MKIVRRKLFFNAAQRFLAFLRLKVHTSQIIPINSSAKRNAHSLVINTLCKSALHHLRKVILQTKKTLRFVLQYIHLFHPSHGGSYFRTAMCLQNLLQNGKQKLHMCLHLLLRKHCSVPLRSSGVLQRQLPQQIMHMMKQTSETKEMWQSSVPSFFKTFRTAVCLKECSAIDREMY